MAIYQSDLLRLGEFKTARMSLEEAKRVGFVTAFLCHSHRDADLARGVQSLFRTRGWDVYIDWDDASMPPVPDRTTADRIRVKIKQVDIFLFLATRNSLASRWCPWELGFADGAKGDDRILVIPTVQDDGITQGSEYLQLYKRIDDAFGELRAVDTFGRTQTLKGAYRPYR